MHSHFFIVKDDTMHTQWMANIPHLGRLRIAELILPGTHNAGMDKKTPNIVLPQEITQDVSPEEQIQQGIRALDLRVSLFETYPVSDPRRFQLFHATSSGRNIADDIVAPVQRFYRELERNGNDAREIIILDFHQFRDFTAQAHTQLHEQLIQTLGNRLIPHHLRDLTLDELWTAHPRRNVVVAYNASKSGTGFWNGVKQRWSGSNLNNTRELKAFMDTVAASNKSDSFLQAIQCAKYVLPFHVPDDFSDKIDEWFKSEDEHSYIQNFRIINTDWSLRSNIVSNCIHANQIKARLRSAPGSGR
jgi:hypothetical protein